MNAAVMTTGPGVMSPIATASRNCRSVSQWCWCTTPSRRNGTIARPLPKMNAPALRKNRPRATRVPPTAVPVSTLNGTAAPAMDPAPPRRMNPGGASQSTMTSPAATNRIAISAPVTAVTVAITTDSTQSRRSRSSVSRASFTAATAMIAMTAWAIP